MYASAKENPDLYWGLRGGGGNFGVVTEFEFELHPVTGRTLIVDLWFTVDDALRVMRGWRDLIATAPRAVTLTAWTGATDGEPRVSVGFVWVGVPDDAATLLADLRSLGRPAAEQVRTSSYLELQQVDDDVEGHAFRRYWKGHYFRDLPDAAVDAFIARGTPDGHGDLLPNASLQAYGGAIADVPDEATAFSHRNTLVEFVAAAKWTDPTEDETRIAAARRYGASLAPYASGAYINALTDEVGPVSNAPTRRKSSPGLPHSNTHGTRTTFSTSTTTSHRLDNQPEGRFRVTAMA